ncbi:hypothetical protein [Paraburkholderia kururiensis]|uniref:hypothetical protein n=1 Tax=Paraburkholderia kururiensis TaxID=984307 RepID=UPI0009E05ACB|nr:hypothetical protein [Paraburkholderia kururiensis]
MVAGVLLWIALAAFVPYVLTPGVEHAIRQDGKPAASMPQNAPGSSPADAAPAVSPGAATPAASPSSFARSATATRLPAPERNEG